MTVLSGFLVVVFALQPTDLMTSSCFRARSRGLTTPSRCSIRPAERYRTARYPARPPATVQRLQDSSRSEYRSPASDVLQAANRLRSTRSTHACLFTGFLRPTTSCRQQTGSGQPGRLIRVCVQGSYGQLRPAGSKQAEVNQVDSYVSVYRGSYGL